MNFDKPPGTQAVRMLREHGVAFSSHPYAYEERGGTETSARALGVDEHAVIKTLIMEDEAKRPLIVLMHGDREVSTKSLARHLGVKTIQPCAPAVADRHSGQSPKVVRLATRGWVKGRPFQLNRRPTGIGDNTDDPTGKFEQGAIAVIEVIGHTNLPTILPHQPRALSSGRGP